MKLTYSRKNLQRITAFNASVQLDFSTGFVSTEHLQYPKRFVKVFYKPNMLSKKYYSTTSVLCNFQIFL